MNQFLYIPESYGQATAEERRATIGRGGCGAGEGWGDKLVPDTIYGLSMLDACKIHDWMYAKGKTQEDKEEADRVFLNNMLRIIDYHTLNSWLKWLRKRRAYKYYDSVDHFGGPAFWNEKNKPAELYRNKPAELYKLV